MEEDVHMDVDVEKSKRLLLLQSSCRTQRNVMLILKACLLWYVDDDADATKGKNKRKVVSVSSTDGDATNKRRRG